MWRGFYINKDIEMIDCFVSIPQDSLHIKSSFPSRISSVNVTRFPGNGGFGHIY